MEGLVCILYHVVIYSSARTTFQICCGQRLTRPSPAIRILYGGNVDVPAFFDVNAGIRDEQPATGFDEG
ncbi:hypothetical protein WQE_47524 [Paraburkholderia hospita]|uniref:Uncharacterized protein n=1 Tax=Paraburkholderia hospita TaxID=169430 RepID=A0ABN0F5H2_9BURK|nr:hypothetical protein WQE_47524 [Paraburkholderia hospita]